MKTRVEEVTERFEADLQRAKIEDMIEALIPCASAAFIHARVPALFGITGVVTYENNNFNFNQTQDFANKLPPINASFVDQNTVYPRKYTEENCISDKKEIFDISPLWFKIDWNDVNKNWEPKFQICWLSDLENIGTIQVQVQSVLPSKDLLDLSCQRKYKSQHVKIVAYLGEKLQWIFSGSELIAEYYMKIMFASGYLSVPGQVLILFQNTDDYAPAKFAKALLETLVQNHK